MKKTVRGHNMPLHPEDFVIIWNDSRTMNEFLDRTGMKKSAANSRAKAMRAKGIKLNRMSGILCTIERIEEVKALAAKTADVWDIDSALERFESRKKHE